MPSQFVSSCCCSEQRQITHLISEEQVERPALRQFRPIGPWKLVCAVALAVMSSIQGAEAVAAQIDLDQYCLIQRNVLNSLCQDIQELTLSGSASDYTGYIDCRHVVEQQFLELEKKLTSSLRENFLGKKETAKVYKTLFDLGIRENRLDEVERVLKSVTRSYKSSGYTTPAPVFFDEIWRMFAIICIDERNYDVAERVLLANQRTRGAYLSTINSINTVLGNIVRVYLEEGKVDAAISLLSRFEYTTPISLDYGADSIKDTAIKQVVKYCIENDLTDEALEVVLLIRGDFDRGKLLGTAVADVIQKNNLVAATKFADAIPDAVFLGSTYPRKELFDVTRSKTRESAYKLIEIYKRISDGYSDISFDGLSLNI